MPEQLHDQYMTAVEEALVKHGRGPERAEWGRISDGEHLDAVFTYAARNAWEHGLIAYWDERAGWQFTALDEERRGTNPEDLPIPYLAAPDAVARAVSAVLAGRLDAHPTGDERWERADQLQAALDEAAAS